MGRHDLDSAGQPERRIVIKSLIDRIVITAPDPVRAKADRAPYDFERADIQWAMWDENGNWIRAQALMTADADRPQSTAKKCARRRRTYSNPNVTPE